MTHDQVSFQKIWIKENVSICQGPQGKMLYLHTLLERVTMVTLISIRAHMHVYRDLKLPPN